MILWVFWDILDNPARTPKGGGGWRGIVPIDLLEAPAHRHFKNLSPSFIVYLKNATWLDLYILRYSITIPLGRGGGVGRRGIAPIDMLDAPAHHHGKKLSPSVIVYLNNAWKNWAASVGSVDFAWRPFLARKSMKMKYVYYYRQKALTDKFNII